MKRYILIILCCICLLPFAADAANAATCQICGDTSNTSICTTCSKNAKNILRPILRSRDISIPDTRLNEDVIDGKLLRRLGDINARALKGIFGAIAGAIGGIITLISGIESWINRRKKKNKIAYFKKTGESKNGNCDKL